MSECMKILLINHYAGSVEMGMEYRPYYLAQEWEKLGHQVTILAADFSHLRSKNPAITEKIEEKSINGISYVFIKTTPYSENNLKRSRNVFDFVGSLYKNAKYFAEKYQPDVVVSSSTYPFDFRPAQKIAAIAGAKTIFEVHDLWPISLISLYGYSKNHPMMKYMEFEEHHALKSADAVVSILPFVDKYMEEQHITAKKYVYIPNGVDIHANKNYEIAEKHTAFLQRYRNKKMFIVMYVGGFAQANALEEFVKAAKLADTETIFVLIGHGAHKINLKRYAKLQHIENIFFLDRILKEQVQDILSMADALYIGAKNTDLYKYGISMNKLFDYLLAGKPIIYGIKSANNPVAEADCGVIIEPQNPEAIASAVAKLKAMDEDKRKSMGKNGHIYAIKNHSYEILAKNFLDIMEEL